MIDAARTRGRAPARAARHVSFALACAAAIGCGGARGPRVEGGATGERRALPDASAALASITAADLARHIAVLASDRFEGRAPGTAGEAATVAYLSAQLRAAGLAPGNPDGTYVQSVPMVGVTSRPALRVEGAELRAGDDFVLWSYGPTTQVRTPPSELVFVGHGVVAPEFDWDDFEGVDLRGKIAVFLIGDPPVPDPADPSRLDARTFRGDAMTYYGRWTYKFETAAERGAAGALIVHETAAAGYGWGVVQANAGRERFELAGAARGHAPVEGWLHLDRARAIFAAAGHDFDRMKAAAARRDFRPRPLGVRADATVDCTFREVRSQNVVARLEGSDPSARGEHVVYSAHWDHLGRDAASGAIYRGALDNASGIAWLLELAEAFPKLPRAPRRSMLFLAVTAEEYGLLGARHYAEHPLWPLERTLANVTMDVMNPWGRTRAIVNLGEGQSTLDPLLAEEAAKQGRRVVPDPEAEKGYFYRSDHFEFARKGVPVLGFLFPGADYVGKPADFGERKRKDYVARVYHTPLDAPMADWDLSGAEEDTQLLFRVGLRVAEEDTWPAWNPGTEFHARRAAR